MKLTAILVVVGVSAARTIRRLIMQLNTNSLLYYHHNRMRGHNWITVRECNCLPMECMECRVLLVILVLLYAELLQQ